MFHEGSSPLAAAEKSSYRPSRMAPLLHCSRSSVPTLATVLRLANKQRVIEQRAPRLRTRDGGLAAAAYRRDQQAAKVGGGIAQRQPPTPGRTAMALHRGKKSAMAVRTSSRDQRETKGARECVSGVLLAGIGGAARLPSTRVDFGDVRAAKRARPRRTGVYPKHARRLEEEEVEPAGPFLPCGRAQTRGSSRKSFMH